MTTVTAPLPEARLAEPEFELTDRDFARIRRLIHERAGISLHAGKRAMVYSRLARRLRETGHNSFSSYLQSIEAPDEAAERQRFVNSLTTNLTAFFREPHHFEALADELRRHRGGAPIRLWCNAASTGEEPYSIAMTVVETQGADAAVELVCSDIDTEVLEHARRGVYAADSRGLSPARLRRHFLRGTGANSGLIRVRRELARLPSFRVFNLMSADWSSLGAPFDFVFCRNVMIYFDAPTQHRLVERLHAALRPGGLLYVGHSENLADARALFRLRGKTVYERC